jgi:hypothetical protein
MWKCHVFYESRPCSVVINLGGRIYRVPEAVPNTMVSLISAKQCRRVVSQTGIFFLFTARSKGERKVTANTKTFGRGLSTQQKKVDKIVEDHKDIFTSPSGVPLHCWVKNSIDLTPGVPLPNDHVSVRSITENEEIKHHI